MSDIELCIEIGRLQGYEEHISVSDEDFHDAMNPCDRIYDAECAKVPNYVKILSRVGAEHLLVLLTAIENAAK